MATKASGYIYCFSNKSMPGIYKIGRTTRSPEIRLKEANASNTYKPPTPYEIAIAKQVDDVNKKEKDIHSTLTNQGKRINPRREFFKAEISEILALFDTIEGDYMHYLNTQLKIAGESGKKGPETELAARMSKLAVSTDELNSASASTKKKTKVYITNVLQEIKNERIKVYRNDSNYLYDVNRASSLRKSCNDKYLIYHVIYSSTDNSRCSWLGEYDAQKNKITRKGIDYVSFAEFASAHYKFIRP